MTRSYRSHGKPDEVGYRLCADVAFGRISVKAVDLRGQPNSNRHSAAIERRIEPSGNLSRETKRLVHGNQTPRDAFLKRLAFDELHHEKLPPL